MFFFSISRDFFKFKSKLCAESNMWEVSDVQQQEVKNVFFWFEFVIIWDLTTVS